MIPRPDPSEHQPYFSRYIDQVPEGDLVHMLRAQAEETRALIRGLPESRGGDRYAPGKWTIREVLGHVIDTERVFAYRALRIARGDTTPLPGFDENAYADASNADARTLTDLADEFGHLRLANVAFFRSLEDDALARRGTVSGTETSVRAIAWIIAGHELHHRALLIDRYLAPAAATAG